MSTNTRPASPARANAWVRHIEAQASSGHTRPAMPEHYVIEFPDGSVVCAIPKTAWGDTTRLDEIESRLKAATPGPWEAHGTTVAAMTGPGECGGCSGVVGGPAHEPACLWSEIAGAGEPDAELIAHAPTDLATLLDVVRKVAGLADWHETKAEKARRFGGEAPVMDKAAQVHDEAARRIRAALAALTETTEEKNG